MPTNVSASTASSSAQGSTQPGQASGGSGGTHVTGNNHPATTLQMLPFYHARPVVPVPPGMEPLPPFRFTRPPRFPVPDAGTLLRRAWYICSAGVNPGVKWTTWEDFRPNIEAHWGLPGMNGPVFRRCDGPLPTSMPSVRVLPPPPRPDVTLAGPHVWAVYVGRVPGIYRSM